MVQILPLVGNDLTTNKIEGINIAINTKNKYYVFLANSTDISTEILWLFYWSVS